MCVVLLLTNVVSTITDVGRNLVHPLTIQKCHLLSECTGQLLIDGSDKMKTLACFRFPNNHKHSNILSLIQILLRLKEMLKLTCTC